MSAGRERSTADGEAPTATDSSGARPPCRYADTEANRDLLLLPLGSRQVRKAAVRTLPAWSSRSGSVLRSGPSRPCTPSGRRAATARRAAPSGRCSG
eukprot:1156726-Prymnesium_polylepis.1